MVDPTKIAIIIHLPAPNSVKQLRTMLGHTGYYRKFIIGYAKITAPMEKLLKKFIQETPRITTEIVDMYDNRLDFMADSHRIYLRPKRSKMDN